MESIEIARAVFGWGFFSAFVGIAAGAIASESGRFKGHQSAAIGVSGAVLSPVALLVMAGYGATLLLGEVRRAREEQRREELERLEREYQKLRKELEFEEQ